MTSVPTLTLSNGTRDGKPVDIPQLGFGTYQIKPAETADAVAAALAAGYRHIDTAEMYGNEKGVGQAVRASRLPREQVFVTSKLNNGYHEHDAALAAFDRTLADLDVDYLDLFLIHWPLPKVGNYVDTWRAMEEMLASGRVRAIGVSNFQTHHLERLLAETGTVPAVNQIEVHPYLTQEGLRAFGGKHGIATEAWSPIAQGKVLDNSTIGRIAARLERTPAQVTLRWHLQRGDIVFPKSTSAKRMAENFALFDFELTDADVAAITALNHDARTGPDPDHFNYVPSAS